MKHIPILMAIGMALAAVAMLPAHPARAGAGHYKIGDKVADFSLKDDAGRAVHLSQFRGKIIVLNFYASW